MCKDHGKITNEVRTSWNISEFGYMHVSYVCRPQCHCNKHQLPDVLKKSPSIVSVEDKEYNLFAFAWQPNA